MILWHVETVAVDEGGLYQRTSGFSKAECDKLPLHHPQESQVGMILTRKDLRNWRRHVVASESDSLPLARADHLAGKQAHLLDRKSTRLNSSHRCISYAVFCLK